MLTKDLDLFEMASLYPRTTGLPMTVWISARGGAKHDAPVKVNTARGDSMLVDQTAILGIHPAPAMVQGRLSSPDFVRVKTWIELNEKALVEYWDGKIDTAEVLGRLIRV